MAASKGMISMPPSASASGRPLLTVENSRRVMKGIRGGKEEADK